MTKAEIRTQIAERKKSFPPSPDGLRRASQTLEKWSAAAVKNFQRLEIFRAARAVGAYMPLTDEVDISPLFPPSHGLRRTSQSLEKIFYIPAFDEASSLYRMARLTAKLKKGRFGILEPAVPVFAREDDIDLIIVPGVAFDGAGGRVGRGGGFYDRLLPQYSAVRVGICFDFQYLEAVPAEEHDIRMDWVVTETRILKIEMNS